MKDFLVFSKEDMKERGLTALDVIIITGDAYVDHPSYGAAVIGRVLEDDGYTVGIISQPDWRSKDAFMGLGRPKLFFGITSGNVDSMVANYTASKKPRRTDDYSPPGKTHARPDRAVVVYANRAREAFRDVPIVIGGIEASLRRLAHHDYWQGSVRRSVIMDAKADILVYGMGESQILEIARRLKNGDDVSRMDGIRGTVVVRPGSYDIQGSVEIPSYEAVSGSGEEFNKAFRMFYENLDPYRSSTIIQRHGDRSVIQFPPAFPPATDELDRIYGLNYARGWHPYYDSLGGVKGYETVRNSIISHRGCAGECSFCSLYAHQGRIVSSRSESSILREAGIIASDKKFRGTITDVGGPTSNLYASECARWEKEGACNDRKCLFPEKCRGLKIDHKKSLSLFDKLLKIPGVKHVFIGSGFRYDLLGCEGAREYLEKVMEKHTGGQMKVAPEHILDHVLSLMNKPSFKEYERFLNKLNGIESKTGKKHYLANYFISAFPGSTLSDALKMALYLEEKKWYPEQVQDFIPLPMTLAGAMYHTGVDPMTGKKVYVSRTTGERQMQRALIQFRDPKNRGNVMKALELLNKKDLAGRLLRRRR